VCVCVCVCVTHGHTHARLHTHTHKCMYVNTYTCKYGCLYVCIYVCIFTYIHTYIYIFNVYMCIRMHIIHIYASFWIDINTEWKDFLLKYPEISLQHGNKIKAYIPTAIWRTIRAATGHYEKILLVNSGVSADFAVKLTTSAFRLLLTWTGT
jgi:hypothetical protein